MLKHSVTDTPEKPDWLKHMEDGRERAAVYAKRMGADTPELVRLLFCYPLENDLRDRFVVESNADEVELIIDLMGLRKDDGSG